MTDEELKTAMRSIAKLTGLNLTEERIEKRHHDIQTPTRGPRAAFEIRTTSGSRTTDDLSARERRTGQQSIRINEQYRLCFQWTDEGAMLVEIVDYH
jgi:hypothetical protein